MIRFWALSIAMAATVCAPPTMAQIVSRPIAKPPAPVAAPPPKPAGAAKPAPAARPAAARAPVQVRPADAMVSNPDFRARNARIRGLLANAEARDVTGEVSKEQAEAEIDLAACRTNGCIDLWLRKREIALSQWAED